MEHPTLELLSGRAFPELAQAMRQALPAIIVRWQEAVGETLPAADQLTFAQIRDDLPNVLEQAAKTLASDQPSAVDKLHAITQVHAETRFHQNFRLEELMTEYAILRPVMLQEVTDRLGRPMTVDEVSALMVAVDVVARQTTLAFVAHQTNQLKAANEAQSKYLSFLSHDLRGGLNGVCLMIEVLKRELSAEERFRESVDDLDMMRRSIFETIATMDRFLHAERFRKGKVQMRPSRVNLKHLLMDVAAQLSYQAKDKGVDLTFETPDEAVMISDKDLLMMVLQNVTANAIKYGARAPVKMAVVPGAHGVWTLAVADRGPGIPADKLATLFAPYTRGDTQGQPGVGLGLNIARQAADLLGAKLWAESDGQTGSTFYLEVRPAVLREQ